MAVLTILELGTELFIVLVNANGLIADLTADQEVLSLTADDIESSVNAVRSQISPVQQDIIDTLGLKGQPIIEKLNILINRITTLGQLLLLVSPHLINFTVNDDFLPIALIAQRTQNSTDEIMRLNPSLRNPNFILQGMVLRVFARSN